MKKSKTMRVASGLLILTLLSTCMVAGTFAKYTSEGSGTDTARVAKWGVEIEANGATFAKSYDTGKTATVESKSDNVVAPGTSGDMVKMTLSGTPETSVKVTYEGAFDFGDDWLVDGKYYCPLVVTVGTTEFKGTSYESADAFESAVNEAIGKKTETYDPNTDLSTKADDSLNVSWKWLFEGGADDQNQTDEKDTALGDAQTAANVTLKVTTTVTQID